MANLCEQPAIQFCKSSAFNFRPGHTGIDWVKCGTLWGNFCHWVYWYTHGKVPAGEMAAARVRLANYLYRLSRSGGMTGAEAVKIWQNVIHLPGEPWSLLETGGGSPPPSPPPPGSQPPASDADPDDPDPGVLPFPAAWDPGDDTTADSITKFLRDPVIGPLKGWHLVLLGGGGLLLLVLKWKLISSELMLRESEGVRSTQKWISIVRTGMFLL